MRGGEHPVVQWFKKTRLAPLSSDLISGHSLYSQGRTFSGTLSPVSFPCRYPPYSVKSPKYGNTFPSKQTTNSATLIVEIKICLNSLSEVLGQHGGEQRNPSTEKTKSSPKICTEQDAG